MMHARRANERIEDALITSGVVPEPDLLRYLAQIYKTRFVSTDKLSKAGRDDSAIERVPRKLAKRLMVFPILFKTRTQTLSIVAADLESHDVSKQVQMVSSARSVDVYIARPAAVAALIRKHYDGDAQAFSALLNSGVEEKLELDGGFDAYGSYGSGGGFDTFDDLIDITAGGAPAPKVDSEPVALSIEAPVDLNLSTAAAPKDPPAAITITAPHLSADLAGGVKAEKSSVDSEGYLETLNVLVALLEQGREDLRGHTSLVARLCKKLCERAGLAEAQRHGIIVAAYLHDLGKASSYHLTALNVAQYEGHRIQAQKTHLAPLRLFESAGLPDGAVQTLTHMYERFDGRGFPDRLKGKDIPFGSRILAVVETYADLTSHAKNPYRRKLDPKEAHEAIERYKNQFFDPTIVGLLERLVLGDELEQRLLADRRTVLLVDPDPEETTVLEMRLLEHSYDVMIARDVGEAMSKIQQGDVDILITEVTLPTSDGFQFVEKLREVSQTELPVIFLTKKGDGESVQRGFAVGAADYLVKPASAEVVAAKAKQILERRDQRRGHGRGVAGSLREMALPDVIQILSQGRKTGRLTVSFGGEEGEVHFGDGAIYDARFGRLSGEEAFYRMLLLVDGDFSLDPDFKPGMRVIQAQTESLLLEGMRRMDEGSRR